MNMNTGIQLCWLQQISASYRHCMITSRLPMTPSLGEDSTFSGLPHELTETDEFGNLDYWPFYIPSSVRMRTTRTIPSGPGQVSLMRPNSHVNGELVLSWLTTKSPT
ncbi:hypothetical protein AVEN_206702-1 [Araneus ventricosus]|uniref:Uncharacterized protein n=1 Tax=Araneus ventricosus TaxID=182803 RepID=A0A4Y2PR55_ARAVE|nr:hypothetical protein AVEN_206702-1 [Araneus ventricosus]